MNPLQSQSSPLQLEDIHLPAAPEFWPPAPGWWLLGVIIISLLIWGSIKLRQWRRLQQQRKQILHLLSQIETTFDPAQSAHHLGQLSILLRRIALTRFPRHQVAALTGTKWLAFLDQTGGKGRFSDGPGKILANGPYQRTTQVDLEQLLPLLRDWVKRNAGGPR